MARWLKISLIIIFTLIVILVGFFFYQEYIGSKKPVVQIKPTVATDDPRAEFEQTAVPVEDMFK